jgi:N-acetylneuraminic acid mutarotase
MKKIIYTLAFILILSELGFSQVVNIPISVTDGSNTYIVRLGLDPTATDCIDPALGESLLPPTPPAGVFDARFVGTNLTPPLACLGDGTMKDYRTGTSNFIGTKIHQVKFQIGTGTTITLSWNLPFGVTGKIYDIITGGALLQDTMIGTGQIIVANPSVITSLFIRINYSLNFPRWTYGTHSIYKIGAATGVSYTRNDTGWVFSIGGYYGGALNNLIVYNVNTNTWVEKTPLPLQLYHSASAVLKDSIYVIGGLGNNSNTVYKYDINANSWITKSNYPVYGYGIKAIGYQDSLIYAAGGLNNSGISINSVYLYNVYTNSWRPATSLPLARAIGAFSRIGDTLVYVGGRNENNTNDVAISYKGIISQTNRSIITWTQGADYPGGIMANFAAAPWGNLGIITVGGTPNILGDISSSKCYVYSPYANTWTQKPDKNIAVYDHIAVSFYMGNNLWKFIATEGNNVTAILDTTEILTDTIPTAPTIAPLLSSPANNSTNVSLTPIMSWNTLSNVTNYKIQISTDSLFGTTNFDTLTTNNTINIPAGKLTTFTKYYWRVRGNNAAGSGPFSGIRNFTTAINTWTYGTRSIYKIYDATGVSYTRNDTGRVFSLGGYWGGGACIGNLIIYNVNTNSWTEKTPIPLAREAAASAILKDSIYIIGGGWGGVHNEVYKYDINSDSWVTKTSYPVSLYGAKGIGYQDSLIYVAGGYNGSAVINNVYLYNVNTNAWRPATSLPSASYFGAFSRTGDTLVYVGGNNGSVPVATTYKGVIMQADRSLINWNQGADYPGGQREQFNAATLGGNRGIIVVGGSNGTTSQSDCYVYSPGANTWTQKANKNIPAYGVLVGSVYTGNNIWKVVATGGHTGGTIANIIDTTEILTDTIPTAPTIAPLLSSPANNSTNVSLTPIMSWNTLLNVTNYKIQISIDSLFGTIKFDSVTINNAINVPSGKLDCCTKYYWRARGNNATGVGSWSGIWNFTTNFNSPNVPVLFQPLNNALNQPINITFQWYKASETLFTQEKFKNESTNDKTSKDSPLTISQYWIEYSTDSTFSTGVVKDSTLVDTIKSVTNLSSLSKYYWRVKAKNSAGWSNFSTIWNFTTLNTGINNISTEIPKEFKLYDNYPNPFNPTTKICFALKEDGRGKKEETKLVVYDILGKEIAVLVNEQLQPGTYEVTFDGSNFPSGVYFYKLTAGNFSDTKKLILMK